MLYPFYIHVISRIFGIWWNHNPNLILAPQEIATDLATTRPTRSHLQQLDVEARGKGKIRNTLADNHHIYIWNRELWCILPGLLMVIGDYDKPYEWDNSYLRIGLYHVIPSNNNFHGNIWWWQSTSILRCSFNQQLQTNQTVVGPLETRMDFSIVCLSNYPQGKYGQLT